MFLHVSERLLVLVWFREFLALFLNSSCLNNSCQCLTVVFIFSVLEPNHCITLTSMMSSQSMPTLSNPVFLRKMTLFDGTIASTGLLKPQNMSDLLGKQMLQYSGAYFTYNSQGKEGAQFTPPWSNSKTSLLDGSSPVSHLSGMEEQTQIIYRHDSNSSEEGHTHSSSMAHAAVKQGFTLHTKSPGVSSPTAAVSVADRIQKNRGDSSSSPSENSVFLAIPKPVYGHNLHNIYCNELSCVLGQRYSVGHGSQRIPKTVYEHDWTQTDPHYTERSPIQRKAQDTLLQQRSLQFEASPEPLKRIPVETYSQGRARTLPARMEPNFSNYPCNPSCTLFGSLNEQNQRLQTSPRGYPSLYPSHPTYERMISEVYQEHSPMSKYGQLTQHPMFYYPQESVEVENRTQCKDMGSKQRDEVPVILKHTMPNPREHYIVPQTLHGEVPLPLATTETLPNHSLMQGYDYPCYAVPRFHLNPSQVRPPLKRQHASPGLHSNRINVSPSSQYMDHPMVFPTKHHKDKPNARLHVDHLHTSSPFQHMDQTSHNRRTNQPVISPSSIQINRYFPSLTSLHLDQTVLPPTGLNVDRLLDFSSCKAQVRCAKQPKGLAVSPQPWLPQSPHHSSDHIHTAVHNNGNVKRVIYSPAVASGNKHNIPVSNSGNTILKGCLKRSISHSSSPIIIKEEERDLCEVELTKKRQKVEKEHLQVGNKFGSPPMPVIDNVFSLAPYQTYLQASGVLFPGRVTQTPIQSSEQCQVEIKSDIKEKRQDRNQQQPSVPLISKEMCANTPAETPVVKTMEPKNIKVERVDPSDTDNSAETPVSQSECNKEEAIKKEPEETDSSSNMHMLVIKKCEPGELANKPSLADENETTDESKPGKVTTQINSSPQGDTCTQQEQLVTAQPKSTTPNSQLPEGKLNFKNIPPQCLKLSTYNIVIPVMKHSSPDTPPERSPIQLTAEFIPKAELQMPVRKHFLELHHSLYKLVSKTVLASSEQELRSWLSKLNLTEPASSTKAQKVSCLLGVKAREVWLNGEIKSALQKLLERLQEYTAQERCPFPHVMRTGAVFLPMLVLKELLFPMVQGSFIDQVLQEHKVELRPTTLSEEKILIQLHKRACSSRLRRLMSLKHLPNIYADVVNLLYYTCVCKHLGKCTLALKLLR